MVRPAAVTSERDTTAEAARIDALCREKARVEIAEAEAVAKATGGVRGQGDVLPEVLLLKGEPGEADRKSRKALAGEDGVAIGKALDALGLPKERYAFCTASTGRRADRARRVRLLVEALDPRVVVLLDPVAAADFAQAFGAEAPRAGEPVETAGRLVVALDDFAGSLADEDAKRRVWNQLKPLSEKNP